MFLTMEVNVEGLLTYLVELNEDIEQGLPDLFSMFNETLQERAERAFDLEGYPTRWIPSIAAIKERRKTLQKSGRLKRSYVEDFGEHFFEVEGTQMLWGSWVPYAPFLSLEDFNPKHVRQVIEFDDELNQSLENNMVEWLEVLMNGE